MSKIICTQCPERCILTEKSKECLQIGNKLWLDRSYSACRQCPNIEETCYDCTRTGNSELGKNVKRDEMGIVLSWEKMSEFLWSDYLQRHPNWKQHDTQKTDK